MRNLKRLMSGVLALVMVMGLTLTVSAAETKPGDEVPSIDGHYVVKELDEKAMEGVPEKDQTAIKDVAKGATTDSFADAIAKNGAKGAQDVAKALAGKEWLTSFFEVRVEPEGQTTVPDHNFDITIKIPGISGYSADDISIVHFNVEKQEWETLSFKLLDGDNVSVHFGSLSPTAVAVVAKQKAETKGAATNTENTDSSSSSSSSKSSSSPKTGVATGWEMYTLVAVAFAICSVAFSRKKRA